MSLLSCQPTVPVSGKAAPKPGAVPAGLTDQQIAQLAADYQAATVAVAAPDVSADLTEAAVDAARVLGLDARDSRSLTVLLALASRSFSHGFMDGAEHEREITARTPLALLLNGRTR